MPTFRAILKLLALFILILAIIPTQWLLLRFGNLALRSARFWHRMLCRVLSIHIECAGTPLIGMQVAYVDNHLSYLDIPVIGRFVLGRFVAKADMQHWPLFGLLAKLQRTVFVSRRPRDAARAVEQMHLALDGGHSLILFPEGTSFAGERVLAFKSNSFPALAAHLEQDLSIRPFSIDPQRVNGRTPHTVEDRNLYAYHADMVLVTHLWAFMQTRGARVRLMFHPALVIIDGSDRKRVAAAAESSVDAWLGRTQLAPDHTSQTRHVLATATGIAG